jgi:leucyl-tRNA synthetase
VHLEPWPQYDAKKMISDMAHVAVQIAGKVRGVIEVSRGAGQEAVIEAAKNDHKLAKYLDFEPKKIVFVTDRVLNLIP